MWSCTCSTPVGGDEGEVERREARSDRNGSALVDGDSGSLDHVEQVEILLERGERCATLTDAADRLA